MLCALRTRGVLILPAALLLFRANAREPCWPGSWSLFQAPCCRPREDGDEDDLPACFSRDATRKDCCSDDVGGGISPLDFNRSKGASEQPAACKKLLSVARQHLGNLETEEGLPARETVQSDCGSVAFALYSVMLGSSSDFVDVEQVLETPWAALLLEPWPLFGGFFLQRRASFGIQGYVIGEHTVISTKGVQCGDVEYRANLVRAVFMDVKLLPPLAVAMSSLSATFSPSNQSPAFSGMSTESATSLPRACCTARAAARIHAAIALWRMAEEAGGADRRAFKEVNLLVTHAHTDLQACPGTLTSNLLMDAWPIAELAHLLWQELWGTRQLGRSDESREARRAAMGAGNGKEDVRGLSGDICAGAIALVKRSPPNGRMLDAGAGTCPCRQAVKEARPDVTYIAQDFAGYTSEAGVGMTSARRIMKLGYCDPLEIMSDITSIPLQNASVDLIYCSNVLEHVPDGVRALRELARLLKPGGYLYLQLPFGGGLHNLPFHYNGGYTHHFFLYHGASLGLAVRSAEYCMTPWSTDVIRLDNMWKQSGACVPLHRQMSAVAAFETIVPAIMQDFRTCAARHPGRSHCVQVIGSKIKHQPPSELEMLFPDSLGVLMKKR